MRTVDSDRGYVTLAVLLVVALLAAITSSLLAAARPALGLARLGGDQAAADGLLQGGVATAAFLLYGANEEAAAVNKLALHQDTGDIRFSAADEAGRIDLNFADPMLLQGLFTAVGGKSMSSQAFANRVLDWRDEDSDLNQDGAEQGTYADAGLDYGPSNLPFHSVDEASMILGLSPRDFALMKPFLTVYSGSAKVDPLSAPETVLRAIPGAGPEDVKRLLRSRGKIQDRARLVESMPNLSDYFLDKPSGVYRVRIDVVLKDGYADAAEAVVSGQPDSGSADHKTVAWSKPLPDMRMQ